MPVNLTRTSVLTTDTDGDGIADVGEALTIRVRITNATPTTLTSLQLFDTQNGLTIDPASIKITPIAFNDTLPTISGNTPYTFSKAAILGNDVDPNDPSATFNVQLGSGTNGTIVDNGDGTLTFTPATGFQGTASFTYSVVNTHEGGETSVTPATVTLNVSGQVWYVDSGYAGANGAADGSYLRPFTALTQLNGVTGDGTTNDDVDGAGDTIFVYDRGSNYTGGIVLEASQKLYGDGHAFTVNGLTIGATTNNATLTQSSGTVVTLSTDNTISGINIAGTGTAAGLSGSTFGTLNVDTTSVQTATGPVLTLSNGSVGSVGFTALTATGTATGTAIALNNVDGGTFSGGNVSIAGATADGINIGGGSAATFQFASTTINNTGGDAVEVNGDDGAVSFTILNSTGATGSALNIVSATHAVSVTNGAISGSGLNVNGGSGDVSVGASITRTNAGSTAAGNAHTAGAVTVSGAVSGTGGVNNGIALTNNTGGTIAFTGNVTLTTGANTAVNMSGTGTTGAAVSFTGGSLTVTTTTGNGIVATGTTLGAGSLAITGSTNSIVTGTGTALSVSTTTIGASGLNFRSIAENGGVNGIVLNNTGTLGGLTVTGDAGSAVNGSGGTIQNTSGAGILLNNTRGVSFDQLNITTTGGSGVQGTSVTNFSHTNSTFSGNGNGSFESGIAFNDSANTLNGSATTSFGNNISGTLTVTGNTFTNPFYSGLDVQADNGAVTTANVSNNTFTNPGFAGVNFVGTGNASTAFNLNDADINNNTLTSVGGTGIQVSVGNANASGPGAHAGFVTIDGNGRPISDPSHIITISGNTVTLDTTAAQAITVANTGGNSGSRTQTNFEIINNGTVATPLGSSSIGTVILVGNNGYSDMAGHVDGNRITATQTPGLGGGNGIAFGNGSTTGSTAVNPRATLSVQNNVISGTDGNGILLVGRGTSGTAYLHVAGNNVGAPVNAGGSAREGIRIDAGNATSVDDAIYLNIHDNTSAGSNTASGIGLRHQGTAATVNDFGIYDAAGGPTLPANPSNTDVTNFVNALNPNSATGGGFGTGGTDIINGSGFTRDATLAPTGTQPAMVAPEPDAPLGAGGQAFHVAKLSGWDLGGALDRIAMDEQDNGLAIAALPSPAPAITGPTPAPEPGADTPAVPDNIAAPAQPSNVLTQAALETVAAEAIARWAAAGATPEQVAAMQAVHLSITDMMGVQVGSASTGAIEIDNDGGGYGWFIDQTPGSDGEFDGTGTALAALADGGAAGRMDLLTVLMHELGHQIGLGDGYNAAGGADLMYGYINLGERRLPAAGEAALGSGHAPVNDAYILSPVANIGSLPVGAAVDITYVATVTAPAGAGLLASLVNTATASFTGGTATSAAEITPVDSLTLGDRVFLDANKNGVFDAGDTGIVGVTLTLFADTNGNGFYDDGVDQAISYIDNNSNGVFDPAVDTPATAGTPGAIALTVTTGANGLYSFSNLAPGDYIIRANAANFTGGGVLTGRRAAGATSDPDNNIDNDSNATQFLPGQAGTYAASQAITLSYNSEPAPGTGNDTNNTLDLGFFIPNQAPVIDLNGAAAGTGSTLAYTENGPAAQIAPSATTTDADSADFNGGSLRVAFTTNGTAADQLTIRNQGTGAGQIGVSGSTVTYGGATIGTFTGGGNGTDLVITFTAAAATAPAAQALEQNILYANTSENPSTAARTVTFTLIDGDGTDGGTGNDTGTAVATINVAAVDDPPVAVADSGATTESTTTTGNVVTNDTDVDGGPKTVTAVNGVIASVGQQITLASGARLTLNADGTYSYNPNGAFNYLVSPATAASTGAADGQATDSFTYTLNGGSVATVTITVTGEDGAGSELRGTSGNNTITGTPQADLFNLSQGGSDTASGGEGNDGFFMGSALDAGDSLDGQGGTLDQVGLQGNYANLVLGANTIKNVEQLVLLSGTSTAFGAPGGQSFTYNITTNDGNIAAGQALAVTANTLVAGENVTFNAAAELDGAIVYYGGLGNDHVTGSQQNDAFFFSEGYFGSGDIVDGQGGTLDQLVLQGSHTITFGAAQLTSIEQLVLISASDVRFPSTADYTYNITMNDANVANGASFSVSANMLTVGENLTFNASAEQTASITVYSGAGNDTLTLGNGNDIIYGGAGTDTINGNGGADRIFGGLGADVLSGGAGADTFVYTAVAESTAASQDHILDFTSGDHIDLQALGGLQLVSGSFTGAGQVRVTSQGGGNYLVEAETTGDTQADLSILVTSDHALTASDFVGVTASNPNSLHGPTVPADVSAGGDAAISSLGIELFAREPLLLSVTPEPVTGEVHDWHGALMAAMPELAPHVIVP